jgi:predicted nucleotidyltransferase
MNAAGVVVEYNPFHNGHLHHLIETKKSTKADIIVAVMSGYFLQRGEPAIVSKWARAEMALKAGIDIVVELPYPFATQHAETFAFGSIAILDALGCDSFCFGSEGGNITSFTHTIEMIEENKQQYNAMIQSFIKDGMSYPSALANAFKTLDKKMEAVDLSQPNNILGYHYIEAKHKLKSSITPFTISRKSAQYHDPQFSSETIASATSIRKNVFDNKMDLSQTQELVPKTSIDILEQYRKRFGQFHNWETYWSLFQYKVISSTIHELRSIYEIEEGIEYRIKACVKEAKSFNEFMNKVKTKRYTWTRLQRMALHILTNTKKEDMLKLQEYPNYIRLLGMTGSGREYLNRIKKQLPIPLISNWSSIGEEQKYLDMKAAEIYALGLQNPKSREDLLKQEWKQPPIILE